MVELVDTPDLGSGAARCAGSIPVMGTTKSPSSNLGDSIIGNALRGEEI